MNNCCSGSTEFSDNLSNSLKKRHCFDIAYRATDFYQEDIWNGILFYYIPNSLFDSLCYMRNDLDCPAKKASFSFLKNN